MESKICKCGNGILGLLREEHNKWERRAPLTPAHCARLLNAGRNGEGVDRIIVQPCTKRIHTDLQYKDVGCEISEDLSECGLILGVKRPKSGTLCSHRAYAFFSHTHKAQRENMPLLDEVLEKHVALYDYELIVGEHGERLVAFGEYAGRAGMIDFLRGLGERFLSLGFSTPFLSLGSSYMYSSLSAAKAAVITVGDEIASSGLPLGLCPLIFVFTGSGNVSQGAQEIFRLLPHSWVDPSDLPGLCTDRMPPTNIPILCNGKSTKARDNFQVYGCVVNASHMVAPNDPVKKFNKDDYYAHPEEYHSVFHQTVAPFASVIVNCMYWERRFPRLLTNHQLEELSKSSASMERPARLLGVADITCDIGGSIECLHQTTSAEQPFLRYNPSTGSYHKDMDGDGIILLAVDCLPTELPKEATRHFGDVLYPFISAMALATTHDDMPYPIKRACIAQNGKLTPLYEYIQRMRSTETRILESSAGSETKKNGKFTRLVSLNGHLFDQFLINEALDVICDAGGRFHLTTCKVGQTDEEMSQADLEVEADSEEGLTHIMDGLAAIATHNESGISQGGDGPRKLCSKTRRSNSTNHDETKVVKVLILGAGRMCEPAVRYLASCNPSSIGGCEGTKLHVIVASLYLEDAEKVTGGIPNSFPVELDVQDASQLSFYVSQAAVVISLLPPACHVPIATVCIELKKHLVTASYVTSEMADLHDTAKEAGVSILCEMGLDPGIDHMMAMQMIDTAHRQGGLVTSFVSFCGGLPSPMAANNPLGYKFSWSPAGAIKAGRNPATYKHEDTIVNVAGEALFSSAEAIRLPNLPAFALERLPNRDSLKYGKLYGISDEASTIFRATLRYEGFSAIMDVIGKLGFFNLQDHPRLGSNSGDGTALQRPTYKLFFQDLLNNALLASSFATSAQDGDIVVEHFVSLGYCADLISARRIWNCIRWLGLDSQREIPERYKNAFEVLCHCLEEKLTYLPNEQDLVLLHHELVVVYNNGRPTEQHTATLLALGETASGSDRKPQSAMARMVGLTVAIGAQLLLLGDIKMRGVLQPLAPEVYTPALKILAAQGMQLEEHSDIL